jgi:hypothetical protein
VSSFVFDEEVIQIREQIAGLHLRPRIGTLVRRNRVIEVGAEDFCKRVLSAADFFAHVSLFPRKFILPPSNDGLISNSSDLMVRSHPFKITVTTREFLGQFQPSEVPPVASQT